MLKEELVAHAMNARENAYVPYSHFKVGAALLTSDGTVYPGCNIENASYPCTMCAERNAIFGAYARGVSIDDIEAIAIVADTAKPVSPCGLCRQVLSELFPHDKPIYLANVNGDIMETTIDDLLPYQFDSEDL